MDVVDKVPKIERESLEKMDKLDIYKKWFWAMIKDYIGCRTLEVGCAIGIWTGHLINSCESLVSIDIEDEYVEKTGLRFGGRRNFEVFKLNDTILKISDLRSGLANPATLDVFFKPPEPSVLFHPDPGSSGDAEIKLELIDGTRAISIKVNRAGQVTF